MLCHRAYLIALALLCGCAAAGLCGCSAGGGVRDFGRLVPKKGDIAAYSEPFVLAPGDAFGFRLVSTSSFDVRVTQQTAQPLRLSRSDGPQPGPLATAEQIDHRIALTVQAQVNLVLRNVGSAVAKGTLSLVPVSVGLDGGDPSGGDGATPAPDASGDASNDGGSHLDGGVARSAGVPTTERYAWIVPGAPDDAPESFPWAPFGRGQL